MPFLTHPTSHFNCLQREVHLKTDPPCVFPEISINLPLQIEHVCGSPLKKPINFHLKNCRFYPKNRPSTKKNLIKIKFFTIISIQTQYSLWSFIPFYFHLYLFINASQLLIEILTNIWNIIINAAATTESWEESAEWNKKPLFCVHCLSENYDHQISNNNKGFV